MYLANGLNREERQKVSDYDIYLIHFYTVQFKCVYEHSQSVYLTQNHVIYDVSL